MTAILVFLLVLLLLPTILRWAVRLFVWFQVRQLRKSEQEFQKEFARQRQAYRNAQEQPRQRYENADIENAQFEEVSPSDLNLDTTEEQFSARPDEPQTSDAEFEEI